MQAPIINIVSKLIITMIIINNNNNKNLIIIIIMIIIKIWKNLKKTIKERREELRIEKYKSKNMQS